MNKIEFDTVEEMCNYIERFAITSFSTNFKDGDYVLEFSS